MQKTFLAQSVKLWLGMAQEEFGSYQILKIYLLGLLGLRRLLGLLEADDATAAGKHHFGPKVSTVGRKFRETEEQFFSTEFSSASIRTMKRKKVSAAF